MFPASCSSALTGLRGASLGRTRSHAAAENVKTIQTEKRPVRSRRILGRERPRGTLAPRRGWRRARSRPANSQKISRVRKLRSAGASTVRRRRGRANRSTITARHGRSAAQRVNTIAQPRTEQRPGRRSSRCPARAPPPRPAGRGESAPNARSRPDAVGWAIWRVTERRRRSRACRGDRQRRRAAADERCVLVEAERERQVDQLSERGDSSGLASALLQDSGRSRPHECNRRRP